MLDAPDIADIRCVSVRLVHGVLFGALVIVAACAPTQHRPTGTATQLETSWPAAAALSPTDIALEVAYLRAALAEEVLSRRPLPERDQQWFAAAWSMLAMRGHGIDRPQLIVVVDRNPAVQELAILLARPDGPWEFIGSRHASTGQAGRRGHCITPIGVFLHTDAILAWRAEGTFNARRIRGFGARGMRVCDFGWARASKGWRADGEEGEIRLLLHATDPDVLESRLGQPASQGCVRISAAMNRFLDLHGVLDREHEATAVGGVRFRALLRSDRPPTPLAGRRLVVVDLTTTIQP